MLIPHGEGGSKSVSISTTVLKLVAGVAVIMGASAAAAAFGVVSRSVDLNHARQLERANQVLSQEVSRLGERVSTLSDTLATISKHSDEVRLVAGLDPLDPEVRRAGIGGPAGPWAEREMLATEGGDVGQHALRVHLDLDALMRRANLLAASFREASDSLSSQIERLSSTPSIMPTEGFLSSRFSQIRYHPILHLNRPHEGIDISAPYGTPIVAPAAGRVVKIGYENGYGLAVEIDHGYGIQTRYAHMSRVAAGLHLGQSIKRGDRLGFVGSTGLSTGPHCHYEVIVNGRPTDPLKFVMPDVIAD